MTVAELIGILNWTPKDYEVIIGNERVTECFINDEYYDGDSCNPNCKVISVVELR